MEYSASRPLRVFTTFSGYDSQCLALDRLKREVPGFDYILVGWSEIEKNAITAHDALYPEAAGLNYGDITKIDWESVPDFDLFTWSFPCQDVSLAGKRRGAEENSGTRSSLGWEAVRAIGIKRPMYCVMENVKALLSEGTKDTFNKMKRRLEEFGYRNYWSVLNAKHCGVPQNRERVFMVSILGEGEPYYFPKPRPLDKKLKDVLEEGVDESYYLSADKVRQVAESMRAGRGAHTGRASKRNERLGAMLAEGKIDPDKAMFVDEYNLSAREDVTGTITARVGESNHYFITEQPK